jgi:hypothetical protein
MTLRVWGAIVMIAFAILLERRGTDCSSGCSVSTQIALVTSGGLHGGLRLEQRMRWRPTQVDAGAEAPIPGDFFSWRVLVVRLPLAVTRRTIATRTYAP